MTTDAEIAAPAPLRKRLGRVAGGRLAPGIGGFWRWWGLALASWLPASMRALLALDGRRLLLRHAAGELRVALERSGQARELVRLPWQADGSGEDPLQGLLPPALAALPRWLVLPANAALRRPMLVTPGQKAAARQAVPGGPDAATGRTAYPQYQPSFLEHALASRMLSAPSDTAAAGLPSRIGPISLCGVKRLWTITAPSRIARLTSACRSATGKPLAKACTSGDANACRSVGM